MRSYCSEWPEHHPEFGLLCPSVRQRRFARLATVFMMSLMVVGASRGLAASHRSAPEDMFVAALPPEDIPLEAQIVAINAEEEHLARPGDACKGPDELAAYFINPGCKIQGRRGQHKIARAVATFTFARIEVQPTSNPLSALTIAMREVASKVAEAEKKVTAAVDGPRKVSAKKHKKEAPIELARAPARPGGMPNNFVSAYTPETKLGHSHGPFTENLGHASRQGLNNPTPKPRG